MSLFPSVKECHRFPSVKDCYWFPSVKECHLFPSVKECHWNSCERIDFFFCNGMSLIFLCQRMPFMSLCQRMSRIFVCHLSMSVTVSLCHRKTFILSQAHNSYSSGSSVKARIEYKVSTLCYQCLNSVAMPSYLCELLQTYKPTRTQDLKTLPS